jgi:hypothetical protein
MGRYAAPLRGVRSAFLRRGDFDQQFCRAPNASHRYADFIQINIFAQQLPGRALQNWGYCSGDRRSRFSGRPVIDSAAQECLNRRDFRSLLLRIPAGERIIRNRPGGRADGSLSAKSGQISAGDPTQPRSVS